MTEDDDPVDEAFEQWRELLDGYDGLKNEVRAREEGLSEFEAQIEQARRTGQTPPVDGLDRYREGVDKARNDLVAFKRDARTFVLGREIPKKLREGRWRFDRAGSPNVRSRLECVLAKAYEYLGPLLSARLRTEARQTRPYGDSQETNAKVLVSFAVDVARELHPSDGPRFDLEDAHGLSFEVLLQHPEVADSLAGDADEVKGKSWSQWGGLRAATAVFLHHAGVPLSPRRIYDLLPSSK